MLVKFSDDMYMQGSVPYDEIGSIREDHNGNGIIRCKSGEVILTSLTYASLLREYENTILEDMEMMMGEEEDDEDV